jgi:TPR repeat protein
MLNRAMFLFFLCLTYTPLQAADIGGWMTQQERAQQGTPAESCAQQAARAGSTASAQLAYTTALCYLHAPQADEVAAKAWLAKAADLQHLPAHKLLNAMARAETQQQHPVNAHCHDLGEGRQLCHGGAQPNTP